MLYYEMFILTYNKQGSDLTVIQVFNFVDSSLVFILGIDKTKQNNTKPNKQTKNIHKYGSENIAEEGTERL